MPTKVWFCFGGNMQIKGMEVALKAGLLLSGGDSIEDTLYKIAKDLIEYLPEEIKDDSNAISYVLHGAAFYISHASNQALGKEIHDTTLARLLSSSRHGI